MADEFANAVEAGTASGETWKPENAGDLIFGTYKAHKSNVGTNDSEVYVIREDGKEEDTSVWGSTVLDARMEEVPINSRVKIEFLGLKDGKRTQYKDYRVVYVANADAQKVAEIIGEHPEVV